MRKLSVMLWAGMMILGLSGCNLLEGDVDTTTVRFEKNGEVKQIIVEDFSQPYYDVEELKSDITARISDYNAKSGDAQAISLEETQLSESNQIKVEIIYHTDDDYQAFNDKVLFFGTVADAYNAGFEFSSMRDVNNEGVVLSSADVLEKGDKYMVILEEAQQVILPGKITYISDGVSMIDTKKAVNLNEGQKAYIIYE